MWLLRGQELRIGRKFEAWQATLELYHSRRRPDPGPEAASKFARVSNLPGSGSVPSGIHGSGP